MNYIDILRDIANGNVIIKTTYPLSSGYLSFIGVGEAYELSSPYVNAKIVRYNQYPLSNSLFTEMRIMGLIDFTHERYVYQRLGEEWFKTTIRYYCISHIGLQTIYKSKLSIAVKYL